MFSLSLNFLPSAAVTGDKYQLFMVVATIIGVVMFVGTIGTCLWFAWKYRRRNDKDHETPYIDGNYTVEFLSIFGISIWAAAFFLWGWYDYADWIAPKPNEYEINVIGQQWNWQIQYTNGKTYMNELYVPKGRHVKLVMTSKDVLHSFFVPEFRVKNDTVPGQFTILRFTPTKSGEYNIFCAEYCGTSHSKMIGKVWVMEQDDFQKWLDGVYSPKGAAVAAASATTAEARVPAQSMADIGATLFKTKTCNTCHSTNGAALVGPSIKGLFGSEVELMSGERVKADENYIRESLMDPMKRLVKGYPPTMPTFRGMLSDEEVNQLIAYMKTLK